ncbi:MAG TPA: MBL fold metallo-hydrolase [Nocardioidaceae bacterium]|nr:MBL fold metallo-hydrolase [Nocardioidaceae bacterium]
MAATEHEGPAGSGHWTEPGAYPVADGVHRIPLPLPMDGLRAVNVYAIETEHGLTLIDGGWAIEESRAQLEASLKQIGYGVPDITTFLVTHAHRDHYTQAVAVRKEFGARVSLGIGDKGTLDMVGDYARVGDPTVAQLRRAGASGLAEQWARAHGGPPEHFDYYEYPDTWLERDHSIEVGSRTLDAVSTPGHTQGHFVFADTEDGVLFAGDHVLPTITPSIGFEPAYAPQPLGDFLASLAKVRALPDLRLLPAHGPVGKRSHQRVDELVAHHEQRLALCRAAVEAGAQTAYDVAQRLPWTRHEREMSELDLFNASLASMETMAHLELLVAQGRIAGADSDGVRTYRGP